MEHIKSFFFVPCTGCSKVTTFLCEAEIFSDAASGLADEIHRLLWNRKCILSLPYPETG
jgi:hypothetical protein